MDATLLNEFREKVNHNNLVLHIYCNYNGKNYWSIICSAMDWIEVVVDSIDIRKLSHNNDNKASVKLITFINCIDILWEAVQQLHRVFSDSNDIPFKDDESVFTHKLFHTDDNNYFKTIRACFAAHPVNLNDAFGSDGQKERRYASWSCGNSFSGDFSVILYSNQPDQNDICLNIYFEELLKFAQLRYTYLREIMKMIDRKTEEYLEACRKRSIEKAADPLAQIKILLQEVHERMGKSFYDSELENLRMIFSTIITNERNRKLVEKYKRALRVEIDEIFTRLQQMDFSELKSWQSKPTRGVSPWLYSFSKLSDAVFGHSYFNRVTMEDFRPYLEDVVDFSQQMSLQELYVVVSAGSYYLNHKWQI